MQVWGAGEKQRRDALMAQKARAVKDQTLKVLQQTADVESLGAALQLLDSSLQCSRLVWCLLNNAMGNFCTGLATS